MSYELYPCTSLVLDTRHIQLAAGGTYSATLVDADNEKGTLSSNGQSITFKNIDWLLVLGPMFGKYRQFNLRVTSSILLTGGTGQAASDFGGSVFYIQMTNAQLVGGYNHLLGSSENSAPLFSGSLTQTTANSHATTGTLSGNLLTFSPSGRYSNVALDVRNLKSLTGRAPQVLGHMALYCDIYPILDSKI